MITRCLGRRDSCVPAAPRWRDGLDLRERADLGSHSVVQTQRAVRAAPAEQDARERAEHRLSIGLRVVAGVLFVATGVYVLAPVAGLAEDFFREPPFVSNSAVKVALIALACLYAAGDVRRRRGLVVAVIAAHVVLVVAVGLMLAFADTSEEFDFGLTLSTVLWAALAFDAAIALGLGMLLWLAHLPGEAPDTASLTAVERRVRAVLIAFTVVFGLGAVAYAAGPVLNSSAEFFRELPLIANSVVKVTMLALLCGYAAAALRRNLAILGPIIAVHVLSVLVSALYLVTLDTDYTLPLFGADVRMTDVLWGAIALDGVIAVVFFVLARSAWNARYRPAFFSQMQTARARRGRRRARRGARGTRSAGGDRGQRRSAPGRAARPAPVALQGGAGDDAAASAARAAAAAVRDRRGRAPAIPGATVQDAAASGRRCSST